MDLLAKMSSCRRRVFTVIFLLLFAGLLPSYGYAPTLLLGLYGQEFFSGDQTGQVGIRGSALLSWRVLMGESASLSLYGRSIAEFSPLRSGQFYDSHTLALEALVRGEGRRVSLEGGLSGSGYGTFEDQAPYLRPDWRVSFERLGEVTLTSVACSGYYLYEPFGSEDALFQGLTAGLFMDPSIRLRYGMEILAGWEYWTEQDRHDLLGSLNASAGGLIGYFLDWGIAAEIGLRWPQNSGERNPYFSLHTDWAWSPHRQVSLELGAFARDDLYLGPATGVESYELSTGFDFRGDWTPNDRLYLVAELSAACRFADDPPQERWSVTARTGVEFSF
jgi:hypothetical protein